MNDFFEECDRLGAEVVRRGALERWRAPVSAPNMRAVVAVGVVCLAAMLATVLG